MARFKVLACIGTEIAGKECDTRKQALGAASVLWLEAGVPWIIITDQGQDEGGRS